jgi:hypothetical protein
LSPPPHSGLGAAATAMSDSRQHSRLADDTLKI